MVVLLNKFALIQAINNIRLQNTETYSFFYIQSFNYKIQLRKWKKTFSKQTLLVYIIKY